jgi:hypothetical protein
MDNETREHVPESIVGTSGMAADEVEEGRGMNI